MKLPDFEAWAIFASVVEHRSFSGAAIALGVSKATVSKAVARLEARLGTTLFHRTSRKLALTDSGKALAGRAQTILTEGLCAEEAALDAAQAPTGLVRVAAPLTFGIRHVAPVIADFLRENPGIEVDLKFSDARIDIVAEGVDIALRIADLPDSSLRARRLMPIRAHVVAAPAYFARAGRPAHPGELSNHSCFLYTNVASPETWRFRGPAGEDVQVRVHGPISTDSGDALMPALRAGLGLAWLPEFIAGDDLAAGTLEAVLDDWMPEPTGLHLVTPPGARRPARVEALIAFLVERFRTGAVTETRAAAT